MENTESSNQHYKLMFPNPELIVRLFVEEIEKIKDECIFVLDTNVLLTPYKIGKESLAEIKKVYKSLIDSNRLFIPGQTIREFAMNRPEKIKELFSAFQKKLSIGDNYFIEDYPFLEGNKTFEQLKVKQETIRNEINEHRELLKRLLTELKKWNWDDPVSELYKELFSSNVIYDPDFSDSDIKTQIEYRNKHRVPPGNKDSSKELNSAGDLIIWLTILRLAEEKKKHIIFVSHDLKNDWYHKSDNQVLSPRYELQYEFQLINPNKSFHIVQLSEFSKLFNVSESIISEIEETELISSFSEDERKILYSIKYQKLLSFNYKKLLRIVEPYCFGRTTAGNKGLRAYQIDGYSLSGHLGWKMFDLLDAEEIKILDQPFDGPRAGYRKGDKGMSQIYREL